MQRKNTVFTFISEPPPTLGEAKVVQGEWNAKEKRSFYFHFRAAAYLGRSQSGARRVECKGKTQEMYERAGGASYFPCGAACVETRFIASHPLGAQPRPGILPPRRAVRAVRDAMNRVATWRTSRADRVCFRDVGYCLRRDAIHRVSPARGVAPLRHSLLRWAIRAVRDAMNHVSTWRTSRADWCVPLQAA